MTICALCLPNSHRCKACFNGEELRATELSSSREGSSVRSSETDKQIKHQGGTVHVLCSYQKGIWVSCKFDALMTLFR